MLLNQYFRIMKFYFTTYPYIGTKQQSYIQWNTDNGFVTTGGTTQTRCRISAIGNCGIPPLYNGILPQTSGPRLNDGTSASSSSISSSVWCGNLIVGNGTTPPTLDDYKVESEITTGIKSESTTIQYDRDAPWVVLRKTISNTSSVEEVTINEIGLTFPFNGTTNAYPTTQLLVYREVLEEPVVLKPLESATFAVKFDLNFA